MEANREFFFAGGGTGGHIYPALAVAERITERAPGAKIHFFCSRRPIDAQILQKTGYHFTPLAAQAFSIRPAGFVRFCRLFLKSFQKAKQILASANRPVVVGLGGFAAAPVCYAAHRLGVPVKLINVDLVPGRANKLIARWADEIFLQFNETVRYLPRTKAIVRVVGCPLRKGFETPDPQRAVDELGLDAEKKILLVTGASTGSASINTTICTLLEKLAEFAKDWQLVHLTGHQHISAVQARYANARIRHKVLAYYENMADLLAAADLVVGRSGAVSIAEYTAAAVPSICMPYPHHKDMHQYLNASKLVEVGAAVIVDDLPDPADRAEWLWEQLQELMSDADERSEMARACAALARPHAAEEIAKSLLAEPQ